MKVVSLSSAVVLFACSVANAATLHVDDFQSGSSIDWFGGASPTYMPAGGPAGSGDAFLQISAGPGSNLSTYNISSRWTGNFTAIGAATISVDMMAPAPPAGDFNGDGTASATDLDDPTTGWRSRFGVNLDGGDFLAWQRDLGKSGSTSLPIRLVVMGPSSKYIRWDSVNFQTVPNDGIWRHYTFSLAQSDLVNVLDNPTPSTYAQLMTAVDHVMFRYDPGSPDATGTGVDSPGGILNLDNIRLAGAATLPVPEPTAAFLSAVSMAILSHRHRRRTLSSMR